VNVDTGELAAITGELSSLRDEVTRLARRVENATEAEAIIRRAGFPEIGTRRADLPARPAHLKLVQ
jgi:hypothetical protein